MEAVLRKSGSSTSGRARFARLGWLLGLVATIASGAWWLTLEKPVTVQVEQAKTTEIMGSFTSEAYVQGREYGLGSEVSGRIVFLGFREGERVDKGSLLFKIDSEDARQALAEAQAATKVAVMESSRAGSALGAARSDLQKRIQAARASVGQAEADLRRVRKGPRAEEIDQAQHRLERAEAIRNEARKQLERTKILVGEGAAPRVSLEAAEAKFATASADSEEARSYLKMLQAGPRLEDLTVASKQVEAAQATLAVVKGGATQLEPLRIQVSVANASVERARAAENRILQAINRSEVRAPVAGVVTKLKAEVGSVVLAGTSVLTLSTREDLRIEAEIGSEDAGKIRSGMGVQVTSPAYPGQTFSAKLISVLPVGELKPDAAIRTRIVRARVQLEKGWELFRPGMEVDVEGVSKLKTALSVPNDAILVSDRGTGVYVVEGNRSHWVSIRTGYVSSSHTEVLKGLKPGQQVVIQGKEKLADGSLVKVRG